MTDTVITPRARVFISCGQKRDSEEETIARLVAEGLRERGFEPYIAVLEQSLRGIKENTFQRLSNSEYFLFIDFKREKLACSDYCRGSLFSHQELALATYLGTDVLAFQESGVQPEDGILRFIQANCRVFEGRSELPAQVLTAVYAQGWDPCWRNSLSLGRQDSDYEDWRHIRFFHIRVRNEHRTSIAHDCTVYLLQVQKRSDDMLLSNDLYEFKWKGVNTPSVAIPPTKSRLFDAFKVYSGNPRQLWLGINEFIVDRKETKEEFTLQGPGIFDLQFVLFSSNFPASTATFRVSIGKRIEDIELWSV